MQLATAISRQRIVEMIVLVIFMLLVSLDRHALIESAAMDFSDSTNSDATKFLKKFGYLDSSKHGASSITPRVIAAAITEYQEFYGLNQTGALDEETVQFMKFPRCGNLDKIKQVQNTDTSITSTPKKRKRSIEGTKKWTRTKLTYKILNYPKSFGSRQDEVDEQIRRAFDSWSAVSPFDFVKTDESVADIILKWAVNKHCQDVDFDGTSGTLAHATWPERGIVHFDDDEPWTLSGRLDEKGKVDLYAVALHELGHVLGIEHKRDRRALMFPIYGAVSQLDQIDISAIQGVYGAKKDQPPPTTPPIRPPVTPPRERGPDLCMDATIDAITMTQANKIFVFKDNWYWILNDDADGIVNGYPRLIAKDWPKLPGSIDTLFQFKDGKMFMFKNDKYWRYTNQHLDDGFPKSISQGFPGIPNNVDGAFISKDDKVFFFKNDEYWKFDWRANPKVAHKYPQSITAWRGVPSSINDVFVWKNGITYFFKDELYYKYNDDTDEVESQGDPPFPRSASEWWFGCDSSLTGSLSSSSTLPELEISNSYFQNTNSTKQESSSKKMSLDSS